jgi:hypothetical protein
MFKRDIEVLREDRGTHEGRVLHPSIPFLHSIISMVIVV